MLTPGLDFSCSLSCGCDDLDGYSSYCVLGPPFLQRCSIHFVFPLNALLLPAVGLVFNHSFLFCLRVYANQVLVLLMYRFGAILLRHNTIYFINIFF